MARSVEKEARNVEEAIQLALDELGIELEDADVEILNEGSKAVLGLFGGKEAKVRVTANVSDTKVISNFLEGLLHTMGITPRVEINDCGDSMTVEIYGEDVGSLIGKHGDTLQAITYLANLILNKEKTEYKRVSIDVENYRKQREEALQRMAAKTADRVTRYKRPITMDPMPSYERRIIHTALQDHRYVETLSQGEEPYRSVVVRLKERK